MSSPDKTSSTSPSLHTLWFDDLLAAEQRRQARLRRFWQMNPGQRVAAMYRGELTVEELDAWRCRHRDQVPLLNGEWWWLAIKTPEITEAQPITLKHRSRVTPTVPAISR